MAILIFSAAWEARFAGSRVVHSGSGGAMGMALFEGAPFRLVCIRKNTAFEASRFGDRRLRSEFPTCPVGRMPCWQPKKSA